MVEDVRPSEVWQALEGDPLAQLIDVRTDAEWTFVGFPDLTKLGKPVYPVSWQVFPSMQLNTGFAAALRDAGLRPDHRLYFICRSGARSAAAADLAQREGWEHSYNVADGFEGPLDAQGHRGSVAGWKAEGLPWVQR